MFPLTLYTDLGYYKKLLKLRLCHDNLVRAD